MRIPGYHFDSVWWVAEHARDRARGECAKTARCGENSANRVLTEIGLVLVVPLAGAAIVGLCLNMLGVY